MLDKFPLNIVLNEHIFHANFTVSFYNSIKSLFYVKVAFDAPLSKEEENNKELKRPDAIIFNEYTKKGLIIELKYNHSAKEAFNDILNRNYEN